MKIMSEVLTAISDDAFWKAIATHTLERAWGREDEVWDNIARQAEDEGVEV